MQYLQRREFQSLIPFAERALARKDEEQRYYVRIRSGRDRNKASVVGDQIWLENYTEADALADMLADRIAGLSLPEASFVELVPYKGRTVVDAAHVPTLTEHRMQASLQLLGNAGSGGDAIQALCTAIVELARDASARAEFAQVQVATERKASVKVHMELIEALKDRNSLALEVEQGGMPMLFDEPSRADGDKFMSWLMKEGLPSLKTAWGNAGAAAGNTAANTETPETPETPAGTTETPAAAEAPPPPPPPAEPPVDGEDAADLGEVADMMVKETVSIFQEHPHLMTPDRLGNILGAFPPEVMDALIAARSATVETDALLTPPPPPEQPSDDPPE
jgi:hypothetical protein